MVEEKTTQRARRENELVYVLASERVRACELASERVRAERTRVCARSERDPLVYLFVLVLVFG